MTAVLLGKWLETMAKGRALKQLSALYELQVKRVRVLRSHGEEWLSADQVQIGDRIRVNQGNGSPLTALFSRDRRMPMNLC